MSGHEASQIRHRFNPAVIALLACFLGDLHLGLDELGNTVNLLSDDDWCPIPKLGKAEAWKP